MAREALGLNEGAKLDAWAWEACIFRDRLWNMDQDLGSIAPWKGNRGLKQIP